jgi:acyl-CoA synthetase (NDP forming)
VALKAQAAELPHKSDAGGVILSIGNERALAEAWAALNRNIETTRPGLELDGVLVECMGEKGAELILGARNDPDWGPVLLAGFGGVLAEAMRDVRLLPPDLSIEQIVRELHSLQCAALFHGFRGSPPLDVEAAARVLAAIGLLIRGHPEIEEIDINPVVVYQKERGAMALDALIVVGANDIEYLEQKERPV